MKFNFKSRVHLRWSDVDEMRHVNNARYLTYMEDARGKYLHKVVDWNWLEDGIILANANLNYKKPLYFTDTVWCQVSVSNLGTKSFEMSYRIYRDVKGEEETVLEATSVQVMFDYKNGKSKEIPEYIRTKVESFEQGDDSITFE